MSEALRISTNRDELDTALIHRFLSTQSTWAKGITFALVQKSIANSLCFGGFVGASQVAFARIITDYATFANLVDVFVLPEYRVRGKPKILFNVHLDTVPSSPAWSADPHTLRVTDDRAIGLGACDIKGAAAALLTAAAQMQGDAAFLFTTDEEANDPRCIAAFLAQKKPFDAVLVAEPTRGEAVLAHRGISSVLMKFRGSAGHASGVHAMRTSALHQTMRWGNAALDFVEAQAHQRFGGLTGLRFNIGKVEGGIKANMIAPSAEVRFGFRPL